MNRFQALRNKREHAKARDNLERVLRLMVKSVGIEHTLARPQIVLISARLTVCSGQVKTDTLLSGI